MDRSVTTQNVPKERPHPNGHHIRSVGNILHFYNYIIINKVILKWINNKDNNFSV